MVNERLTRAWIALAKRFSRGIGLKLGKQRREQMLIRAPASH